MDGCGDKSYVGMMTCFYCREEFGVLLDRRMRNTLCHRQIVSMEPCPKCQGVMDSGGIILVGTSTSPEMVERQRLAAKKEYDSWSMLKKKSRGFNFIPDITYLGMVGIAPGEPAQRVSDMFSGVVKPGGWSLVEKEVWDEVFVPIIE